MADYERATILVVRGRKVSAADFVFVVYLAVQMHIREVYPSPNLFCMIKYDGYRGRDFVSRLLATW